MITTFDLQNAIKQHIINVWLLTSHEKITKQFCELFPRRSPRKYLYTEISASELICPTSDFDLLTLSSCRFA